MRRLGLAVLVAAAPATAGAPAESEPAPTQVHAQLSGSTALVAARFVVPLADHAFPAGSLSIAMPRRGVVTGARVTIAGVAHRLALQPAETVDRATQVFAERAGGAPAWAASVTAGSGLSVVQIFAPRAGRATVDLEIEAPTCFFRDARYLDVPSTWHHDTSDRAVADACPGDAWLRFAGAQVASRADRLQLKSADVARVEFDLASVLSKVPADLHTAFVVDGSRSLTAQERTAQAAIIASYLAHAPNTRVQLISYARSASALLPAWGASEASGAAIERELRALVPRNGSNIDAGLAEASTWLGRVKGTRRIVVFTDELIAGRLGAMDPATLARGLPPGTLVHVVAMSTGAIARDDDAQLAPLASATGGMFVRGGPDDRGAVDATELVRPIAVDRVSVRAAGWTATADVVGDVACTDRLAEGRSCVWWGTGSATSGPLQIEGWVWGQKLTRALPTDTTHARSVARELSAAGAFGGALGTEIDRAALAVNTVWSLFASWGGDSSRSDEMYGSLVGNETCTCDDTHPPSLHGIAGVGVAIAIDLRPQLAPVVATCHAKGRVDIDIELTGEEIVDVAVHGPPPAVASCIADVVWNTAVTVVNAPTHAKTHVAL